VRTGRAGLTQQEAARLHLQDGPNELPSEQSRGFIAQAWAVISEPMIILLIAAAVISLLLVELLDSILLTLTVFVVVAISIVQERRTERALDALRDLSAPRALVLRDGEQVRVPGREVVVGDVIFLAEGDRIPADSVLVEASNISVDESALTGESVPVRKVSVDGAFDAVRPGGDDSPWVFSGTLVVRGHGVALVQRIGAQTELGRIGAALSTLTEERTLLQREINRLVRVVAVLGIAAAVTVVVVFGFTRGDWLQGMLAGIAASMSLLPEEFPVILTVFMALGAWRMSKSKVLSRRAPVIEALGSATVLCVDKTGTLTINSMTVREFIVDGYAHHVDGALHRDAHAAAEIGALASPVHPFDPMDRAFRDVEQEHLADSRVRRNDWELVREYPLHPGLLAIGNAWRTERGVVVAAKGAPEAILDLAHANDRERDLHFEAVERAAARGERVLALAIARWPSDTELPEHLNGFDFEVAGLAGLIDPVRPGVAGAVEECHTAGVRVVMITGDYPRTALAIAEEIGLDVSAGVITGPHLEEMSDEELQARVGDVQVFARMVPEQKLRLIRALQARHEVVGMTGDGVNDAPALRAADIGIAMGQRGTDVARESADLVITDDDFASIVEGVRQGRRIFDNLRKAMAYVVAIHVVIFGMALIPVFGPTWPLILLPLQIAMLELVIDPSCSIAFEAEQPAEDTMRRPPRPRSESILTRRVLGLSFLQGLSTLVAVFAIFLYAIANGLSDGQVRTATFAALMAGNLMLISVNRSWHLGMVRTIRERHNPVFRWVIGIAMVVTLLLVSVPAVQSAFRFEGIPASMVALSCAAGAVGPVWFEAYKRKARDFGH
jgi:Ca2+-transporting ATPase